MSLPIAFVVEDDPQINQIFSMALGKMFAIESIMDGNAALERLKESAPHLVILDVNLPGADGVQILQFIRQDARLSKTRVVVVTANPRQPSSLEEQADIVLIKPVSIAQLRALAERMKL